jgi:hypothetical protein
MMMAFGAVKIVRIAIAPATATSSTVIRFLFGSDPFLSLLNKPIFLPFFCQLFATPFNSTGLPVTVSAG